MCVCALLVWLCAPVLAPSIYSSGAIYPSYLHSISSSLHYFPPAVWHLLTLHQLPTTWLPFLRASINKVTTLISATQLLPISPLSLGEWQWVSRGLGQNLSFLLLTLLVSVSQATRLPSNLLINIFISALHITSYQGCHFLHRLPVWLWNPFTTAMGRHPWLGSSSVSFWR